MTIEDTGKVVSTAANVASADDQEDQRDSLIALEGVPKKLPYPKSIFFIISNEFCERFNYFGMRTIQALYFTDKLMFDKNTATVLYHTFTTMVYSMCIFGAILSDSFLGKYKTILYLSFVYVLGSATVAIGAIPSFLPAISTAAIGSFLIAVGSGGIKPCVAAFGGDQFELPAQLDQMASFFSVFYFAINSGTVIATFITPILRHEVHCFGQNDCYSLAFGVPGMLMVFAIVLFVSGKPLYKIHPPSGNMLLLVLKCIKNAIATKHREKKIKPRKHWLDYSEEKYGKQLVAETKSLLKVFVLFVPLPLFWTVYDQQGSRWTFQAQNMDGNIGFYQIKPDQMYVANSFLVLVFIPLCEIVIYPMLSRIGIRRPLQKMTIGMLLAALAFLMSGLVELRIEGLQPIQPTEGQARLRFINGLACDYTVNTNISSAKRFDLDRFKMSEEKYAEAWAPKALGFTLTSNGSNCPQQIRSGIVLNPRTTTTVFVSSHEIKEEDVYIDSLQRAQTPMLRVLFSSLADNPGHEVKIITPSDNNRVAFVGSLSDRRLVPIISGMHEVHIDGQKYKTIELKDGSVSAMIVLETPNKQTKFEIHLVEITGPNSVNMLWQLPQYIVMTMGEVMFSVTGLEFTYAQAPASMKSVLQACWLLCVAFGNIIIMSIAGARFFKSQAHEFFLFAGLLLMNMLLFMVFAKNYKNTVNQRLKGAPLADEPISTKNRFTKQ